MNILIVDSDHGIYEYYRSLLESEFRLIEVTFVSSPDDAAEELAKGETDLVITETRLGHRDIFEFLKYLTKMRLPFIIVSGEPSERLMVECMREGAMDFISKANIKLGLLPLIIKRALLEGDRWVKINDFSDSLMHRPEFLELDERARQFVRAERQETMRKGIGRDGQGKVQELVEGQTYFIVYVYVQFYAPERFEKEFDENTTGTIRSRILNNIGDIGRKYGGQLWNMKEDGCYFAFVGEGYLSATLAAVEMSCSMNIHNLTIENFDEMLGLNIGITCGETVYRKIKGDIYSEALNLSAHMAIYNEEKPGALITGDIYDHLGPRVRKYFFKTAPFEGYPAYRYERIV